MRSKPQLKHRRPATSPAADKNKIELGRLIRLISIRSSRPSPSSNTGCAPLKSNTGGISAAWLHPSNPTNATTPSPTPDTLLSKREPLLAGVQTAPAVGRSVCAHEPDDLHRDSKCRQWLRNQASRKLKRHPKRGQAPLRTGYMADKRHVAIGCPPRPICNYRLVRLVDRPAFTEKITPQ